MTRLGLAKLASEVGITPLTFDCLTGGEFYDRLGRFAQIIATNEREACLSECKDLLTVSARQAKDGDHFEIGRESGHTECIDAISARGAA